MLVTMKEILLRANKGGYAVAAPNVCSELDARGALEAAEELNAPVILAVAGTAHPDMVFFGRYLTELCARSKVPAAINLDHGTEYAQAIRAIRAGFTSIMIDRSTLPFEENVREVSELVKVAHSVGVTVEAELGHVGQGQSYDDDRDAGLTDPNQAKEYIERTGVDCLAVAIGTAHGAYKGVPLGLKIIERCAAVENAGKIHAEPLCDLPCGNDRATGADRKQPSPRRIIVRRCHDLVGQRNVPTHQCAVNIGQKDGFHRRSYRRIDEWRLPYE